MAARTNFGFFWVFVAYIHSGKENPVKLIGLLTWAKIAQRIMVSSQSVYFIWVICTQLKKLGFSTLIPKMFTQKNTLFYLQCASSELTLFRKCGKTVV